MMASSSRSARCACPNPRENATLDVELPVDPKQFRYLDLSREPDDDPGHSTVSILRGPVT